MKKIVFVSVLSLFAPVQQQNDSFSSSSDDGVPLMPQEEFVKVTNHIRNVHFSWYNEKEESICISIGYDMYLIEVYKLTNQKTGASIDSAEDFFNLVLRNKDKALEGREWKPN